MRIMLTVIFYKEISIMATEIREKKSNSEYSTKVQCVLRLHCKLYQAQSI